MKASFYDVKAHASVDAEVLEAVAYPNNRYAFKAQTKDGRNLTRFVSKADYDKFQKGGSCAKKCGCKK